MAQEGRIPVNGAKVKRLREGKGWRQEDLLKAVNQLSQKDSTVKPIEDLKTIATMEAGQPKYVPTVYAVARALEVTVDDLRLDEILSKFTSFMEDRTQGFVGRQFVFKAIEEFQKAKPAGYFVIEGPPGIGKSAIIAQYTKRTGCVVHFNNRSAGVTGADQFLRSLCAQLSARFGWPDSSPPAGADRDGAYLVGMLEKCAERLRAGEILVLAVDALDEASTTDRAPGANILFLPHVLPRGVHFVVTTRRKANLPLSVQAPEELFDLRKHAEDNRFDVEEYLRDASKRTKLKRWIGDHGLSAEEFVSAMADMSEGNFMYLRFVVPAIERGDYRDLKITDLPRGLERYYEDHWERMGMTTKPVPLRKIKMLCVLAEADMPMSRGMIANYCGEDELAVLDVLEEWSEFLQEQFVETAKCYGMYHASFRDFLRRKDVLQAAGLTTSQVRGLIMDSFSKRMPDDE